MDDMPEVTCDDCYWEGFSFDLECSDYDLKSSKPASDIRFNRCPSCGSINISDTDYDDDWE